MELGRPCAGLRAAEATRARPVLDAGDLAALALERAHQFAADVQSAHPVLVPGGVKDPAAFVQPEVVRGRAWDREAGHLSWVRQVAGIDHVHDARSREVFLAHEHVTARGPVPGVVSLAAAGVDTAYLDRVRWRAPGDSVTDVQDHQPRVPVGQKSETVADVDVVKEAGSSIIAGHDRRVAGGRDIEHAKAVTDSVDHHVHVVALDPDVVDSGL